MRILNKSLFISLLLSSTSFADTSSKIKDALLDFKEGQYKNVISNLEKLSHTQKNSLITKHYLLALSYNRIHSYDLAISHFRTAIKLGSRATDLYYEFGQALYANNELTKSRIAFSKSYKLNYKQESSLYYVAHISQILEEYKQAKASYVKLIKSKNNDTALLQVARFQLAEVLLSMARTKAETERLVEKFVLPQMDLALKVDKSSSLSGEIFNRKKEIEKEFGLDPNLLYNGRRIDQRRWNASIDQQFSYDNNISLTSDLPASAASLEDSFIFRTKANASYDWILKKRFIISPETSLDYKKHTNRESINVKTQDSFDLGAGLNNSYEHKLFNNPASLLFDINYNYSGRYRADTNENSFYSRYMSYSLGEKFKYFTKGDTTFKVKYKDLISKTKDQNAKTTGFSADQTYLTLRGNILLFLLSYDSMDTYNNPKNSTNTTLLRFDFINPTLFPNITLLMGASMSFIDYVDPTESLTRGVEKTFTPVIKLTKKVTKKLKFTVSYEYTKNTSLKSDYQYTKHVTTSALKYKF
ncbi:tetratricopeptide repeat protein [Halobacteriovorax sp. HLS]|uniref:tetratricopeptide repeat protein n=1 Tax=Halobacteriovorax sp. HLS TaxID=2234000 RepID=UPI000FD86A7A|nr:tetratricopeptide repeat protein [Halobacteriovorax sp. HLS]